MAIGDDLSPRNSLITQYEMKDGRNRIKCRFLSFRMDVVCRLGAVCSTGNHRATHREFSMKPEREDLAARLMTLSRRGKISKPAKRPRQGM